MDQQLLPSPNLGPEAFGGKGFACVLTLIISNTLWFERWVRDPWQSWSRPQFCLSEDGGEVKVKLLRCAG